GRRSFPSLQVCTMSKDAPSNAGELVGERDGEDVVMQPLLGRLEPRLEAVALRAVGLDQHNPCPAACPARTSSLMPSTVSTAFLFAVAAAGMRRSNSTSASASPMPSLLMPFTSASAARA